MVKERLKGHLPATQMPREWPEMFLHRISRDVSGCRVRGHPGRSDPPKGPACGAGTERFLAGPSEENSGVHSSKPHTSRKGFHVAF